MGGMARNLLHAETLLSRSQDGILTNPIGKVENESLEIGFCVLSPAYVVRGDTKPTSVLSPHRLIITSHSVSDISLYNISTSALEPSQSEE